MTPEAVSFMMPDHCRSQLIKPIPTRAKRQREGLSVNHEYITARCFGPAS